MATQCQLSETFKNMEYKRKIALQLHLSQQMNKNAKLHSETASNLIKWWKFEIDRFFEEVYRRRYYFKDAFLRKLAKNNFASRLEDFIINFLSVHSCFFLYVTRICIHRCHMTLHPNIANLPHPGDVLVTRWSLPKSPVSR